MAEISLLVRVTGAAPAEAEQLAMRLLLATRPVKTTLVAAGHSITAKAAMPCAGCDELVDVRSQGLCATCTAKAAMPCECCGERVGAGSQGLCPICAGDQTVERQLEDPLRRVSFPLQVAEAAL